MRAGLAVDDPAGLADEPGAFVLVNPHPLAETLPGVYREAWLDERRRTAREPFGTRFISALDDVLAPILSTLDNFESYLDPTTTSDDFLAWLGEWVAASVDASWPEDRRRAFVAQAAELYRRRGTAAGLHDHVQIYTGGMVEIVENGASSWSATPEGKLPGSPEPVVVVRVIVDDPDSIDRTKLDDMVRASKPAHVVHRVELVATAKRATGRAKPPSAADTVAEAAIEASAEAAEASVTPTEAAAKPADTSAATEAVSTAPEVKAKAETPAKPATESAAKPSDAPAKPSAKADAPPTTDETPKTTDDPDPAT
ncbi:MAG TPA: phage tail protein [Frankiaceae bacterium]|nr:phage tail protein [Frankiaceae bacterium]